MNQLLVSIDSPEGMAVRWRVPTTIRAVEGDVDVVRDILVSTGTPPVPVTVPPGNYVVEAYLPSGEMLRRSAAIESGKDAAVRLLMTPSPHEWLQSSARIATGNRLRSFSKITSGIALSVQSGAEAAKNPFISPRTWL